MPANDAPSAKVTADCHAELGMVLGMTLATSGGGARVASTFGRGWKTTGGGAGAT